MRPNPTLKEIVMVRKSNKPSSSTCDCKIAKKNSFIQLEWGNSIGKTLRVISDLVYLYKIFESVKTFLEQSNLFG